MFFFLNELPEYNDEILKILKEEYPGLGWILVFKDHGAASCLNELKGLRKNELTRSNISKDGLELLGLVGDILQTCN